MDQICFSTRNRFVLYPDCVMGGCGLAADQRRAAAMVCDVIGGARRPLGLDRRRPKGQLGSQALPRRVARLNFEANNINALDGPDLGCPLIRPHVAADHRRPSAAEGLLHAYPVKLESRVTRPRRSGQCRAADRQSTVRPSVRDGAQSSRRLLRIGRRACARFERKSIGRPAFERARLNMKRLIILIALLAAVPAFAQSYQDSGGTTVTASVPIAPGVGPLFTAAHPGVVIPAGTPVEASTTGTTAATAATLPAAVGKTTYICGFDISANATAAATGNAAVTGPTNALNFTQWTAPATSGAGVIAKAFSPCIPASAPNTAVVVTSAAPGTGGVVSVSAWGYQQ